MGVAPLLPHHHIYYITTYLLCQEVFQLFENFLHHSVAHSLTLGVMVSIPLDIVIIPHQRAKYNRQNAQNWKNNLTDLCAICLLTNCWRSGIMDNSARLNRGRTAQKPNEKSEVKTSLLIFIFFIANLVNQFFKLFITQSSRILCLEDAPTHAFP